MMIRWKRAKAKKARITAEMLRANVHYDPDTGRFTRIVIRAPHATTGRFNSNGYERFMVCGVSSYAHQWAWLYMTGSWPAQEIDHINGDRSDNRWANLRQVSRCINGQNQRRAHSNSSTGLLGVRRNKGRFMAQICVEGKRIELGSFRDPNEASAAYLEAKRKLHPGCTI